MRDGKYTGLAVAVVLAGVLASCSGSGDRSGGGSGGSGDDRGGAALSVGKVKEMAADPGDTCPVSYDMAAATKAAGIKERVKKGKVEGESPDKSDPQAPLNSFRGALVNCAYRIGEERVHVFTVGTGKGTAVNVLLPQIQHDAGMDMEALKAYAAKANEAPRGKPLLTPSGNVASVRLPVAGKGDVALIFGIGDGGTEKSEVTKAQVTDVARELAVQAGS
ncbi:hypothetical protein [Streptomyces iconiensis]|uniref:DUF3558 domain-containing protein n=1 Tax=Streptomyces iconiensis TaxID=1384038 RepID=A0ABT6ZXI9_9ACTN|nr:hypothetical protein [Streptomyces iconiensis]MDJ1133524.1 hypothetical protein [Streptomyces iconiensis]